MPTTPIVPTDIDLIFDKPGRLWTPSEDNRVRQWVCEIKQRKKLYTIARDWLVNELPEAVWNEFYATNKRAERGAPPPSSRYDLTVRGSALLSDSDILDLPRLAARLKQSSSIDPILQELWQLLPIGTRDRLGTYSGGENPPLKEALIIDLNQIVANGRFDRTRLEEAFPDELSSNHGYDPQKGRRFWSYLRMRFEFFCGERRGNEFKEKGPNRKP